MKRVKTPRGSVQITPHAKGYAVRVVSRTEAYTTYYSDKQRAVRHFRHYRDLFTGGSHAC